MILLTEAPLITHISYNYFLKNHLVNQAEAYHPDSYYSVAARLSKEIENSYYPNQYSNLSNRLAHYETTGPEIWKDTNESVTHFVSAMGTTGTIMGVSRYLKEQNSDIQIVGTQPTEGSRIPGIRRWSKEFLPAIYEAHRVDQIIDITQDQAKSMARRLAKEEGILSGMSSGGALSAAIKVAKNISKGIIVFIVCDRGDRYLSTDLFDQ